MKTTRDRAIDKALDSCYRSGWPLPLTIERSMEQFDWESNSDFRDRLTSARANYEDQMREIVIAAIDDNNLKRVLDLGKLAKTDLNKALYILGWIDEP